MLALRLDGEQHRNKISANVATFAMLAIFVS